MVCLCRWSFADGPSLEMVFLYKLSFNLSLQVVSWSFFTDGFFSSDLSLHMISLFKWFLFTDGFFLQKISLYRWFLFADNHSLLVSSLYMWYLLACGISLQVVYPEKVGYCRQWFPLSKSNLNVIFLKTLSHRLIWHYSSKHKRF